jgi:hypothetical protein
VVTGSFASGSPGSPFKDRSYHEDIGIFVYLRMYLVTLRLYEK